MWRKNLPRNIVGMHLSESTADDTDLTGVPWVKFLAIVGEGGKDYSEWSNSGHGVVCRLRYGPWYDFGGTIPKEAFYDEGARETADFVAGSRGCHIWEQEEREAAGPDHHAGYVCGLLC